MPMKLTSVCSTADAMRKRPLPEPISRITGCAFPNSAAKSSGTSPVSRGLMAISVIAPQLTMPSVRILGVDPGSVNTGFGVIDSARGALNLVEHGTITTKRGADLADRLCRIHAELTAV